MIVPGTTVKDQAIERRDAGPFPGSSCGRRLFLHPTVVFIGVQMSSVFILVLLLLLMISVRPGDGGSDGGGRGHGSAGQDGLGEFAVRATGGGSLSDVTSAGHAMSEFQPVDAVKAEQTASAPPADQKAPPQNAGSLLDEQSENRGKVVVMPEFPVPADRFQPAGAGGADGFSDLEDRLRKAGAKTGDVQISLAWNNGNDLDLHVETPGGEKIFFNQRVSSCGGELDVDMNATGAQSNTPVENIFWPEGGAPAGRFRVLVHHYANHGGRDPTGYQVTIKVRGESKKYNGSVKAGDPLQNVDEFVVE